MKGNNKPHPIERFLDWVFNDSIAMFIIVVILLLIAFLS